MENTYGQGAGRKMLQLTADEARSGCVKEVVLGNQLYQIAIPAGAVTGNLFELRGDNGALLGTVEVQVTGSINMAAAATTAANAAAQNAAAGPQYTAPQDAQYTAPQYTQGTQYTAPQGAQSTNAGAQYNNVAYGAPGAPAPKKKGKKTGLWVTLGIVAFLLVGGVLFYNFYHVYDEPTCTEPAVCRICHREIKPALGHDWLEATYDAPQTCSRCGETTGDVKGMVYNITSHWDDDRLTIGDWNYPILELDTPLDDVRKIQISITFEELNANLYHIQFKSNGQWYHWDMEAVDGQTEYNEWFYLSEPMRIEAIAVTDDSDESYSISLGVTAAQCGAD